MKREKHKFLAFLIVIMLLGMPLSQAEALTEGTVANGAEVAIGENSEAEGENAIAIGDSTNADGDESIAIGTGSYGVKDTILIGNHLATYSEGAIIIGNDIGFSPNTDSPLTIIGRNISYSTSYTIPVNERTGVYIGNDISGIASSVVIGGHISAGKDAGGVEALQSAVLIGRDITFLGRDVNHEDWAILIGSEISGYDESIIIGNSTRANNTSTIAIGNHGLAQGWYAIALGDSAEAVGQSSVAIGRNANALANSSIAIGDLAFTFNDDSGDYLSGAYGSIAVGQQTETYGKRSIAVGLYSFVYGENSTAIGSYNETHSNYATALGAFSYIKENADFSVAIGTGATATEPNTVSLGYTAGNENPNLWQISGTPLTRRLVNMSAGLDNTDAVNISQLKKHGTDIASALGGSSSYTFDSSNGTGTLTTGLEVGGTTYTSVQDALNAVDGGTGGGSALSVNYDDESKETVTLGNPSGGTTVTNVKAGELSETSTDAINGSQLYETNERVGDLETNVGDITTNLSTLDGLAVKYDDESKTSITLGNGTDKVSVKNVADGVDTNDAVNKGQLDAGIADAKASGKWNLKVNDGAAEEISGGKIVTLKDGTNVAITKDADGNYVFSTVAAPEFDSVTIRNTNISINSDGIDMGDKKIINLQRGDISEGSTEAVTGGQLYETNQTIQQLDSSSVKYDANSDKTKITLEGSGGTTITNVKAGELSESSTDAINGSQLYATNERVGDLETNVGDITTDLLTLDGLAVKYDDESKTSITLGNGTDKVSIKNVADGVDANDAVNKGQLDAGFADAKASGKWNLKVNDSAAEEISGGKVVTLKDGTNVAITKDADGNYVFSTVATPEFDSVTIRNTNISINSDGIDMGDKKIINLQRGDVSEGSSDAVTGGQLYETNQTIQQLDASSVKYDDGSDKTKITLEGTGGTTITNVKAGELSETSTDAVNGSQLYETNQNLASLDGLAVKYKEGSTNRLELNDGDNGTVRISNVATPENDTDAVNKKYVDDKTTDISEDLEGLSGSVVKYNEGSDKTKITLEGTGGTTITNVKAGELSETSTDAVNGSQLYETNQNLASLNGLAVKYDDESKTSITLGNGADKVSIKNVADGVDANDAVNKGQLDAGIADAKASGKWNLKVNDSAAEEISGGKVVTLKDGTNVAITKDADGNYVFSTVAAPEFDSVTIRNTNISINSDGIDMGDKKIINLQRGDVSEGSSDAVTGGQLYETNQTIQQLDASSVKYDDGSDKTKITLEGTGGTTITNVKAGELSETSTDAVNGSQLYATNERVGDLETNVGDITTNLSKLDGLTVKYDDESKTSISLGNGTDKVTIKNVADGVDANDAVNKGQLDKGLEDTLASANAKSKWSLKVNDGEAEEIGDGKVVTLKDGTNVAITKDADGNYVFSTVAAPEFDAISIRNTNISISSTGINMGGLKITNLQRGDVSEGSTDAVTGGQLHETNQRIDEIETNVGSLSNSAVKYDDETKSSVTLEGTDGTRIGNVADGVDSKDAVNKGQLDSVKSELEGQISENVTNINNKIENIEGDITNLDDRVTKLEDLDYLGDAAVTYDGNDKSSVTLKGENGTKISNLADGTEESDAVNFGQLSEVKGLSEANAEKLEEHSVYIENHEQEFKTLQTVLGDGYSNPTFNTIKIGNISSDGTNINMGGGIITGLGDGGIYPGSTDAVTGNQLWNAYKRMDDLQESINIVGAHAAAMSGLHPVPYNPYEPTTLSAAFGTYRDEYAVAVGVFHYVRSNLMFNLGASLCSDGDIMGRAGVSIAVGPNSKKKPELARDMVTMQQIQVQSQYRIQELEAEIAALKQQITQITSASK